VDFTLDSSDEVWRSIADLQFELAKKQLAEHAKEMNGLQAEMEALKATKGKIPAREIKNFKARQHHMITYTYPLLQAHTRVAAYIHKVLVEKVLRQCDGYPSLFQQVCPEAPHITRWDEAHIEELLYRDAWYTDHKDLIGDYILDCIRRAEPFSKVLRLLTLASQCSSGLKREAEISLANSKSYYAEYVDAIEMTYGFEATLVLERMIRVGMIRLVEQTFHGIEGQCDWDKVSSALMLTSDSITEEQKDDGDVLDEPIVEEEDFFTPGTLVRVSSSNPQFHGQTGVVEEYHEKSDKYKLKMALHEGKLSKVAVKRDGVAKKEQKCYFTKFVRGPHAHEDLTFLYDYYAPLSLRLVELALENQWAANQARLDLIPGEMVNEVHDHRPAAPRGRGSDNSRAAARRIQSIFRGHRVRNSSSEDALREAASHTIASHGRHDIIFEGRMKKKGTNFPWNWNERHFELRGKMLSYQCAKDDGEVLGFLNLGEWFLDTEWSDTQPEGIMLKSRTSEKEQLQLQTFSIADKRKWMKMFAKACIHEQELDMSGSRVDVPPGLIPTLSGAMMPCEEAEAISESVTLIFFIGGCTRSEIAGIRHLAQRENQTFMVGTTGIISGDSLTSSLVSAFTTSDISSMF